MKNEREFTGTLMGFDDYVSKSPLPPLSPLFISISLSLYKERWLKLIYDCVVMSSIGYGLIRSLDMVLKDVKE